MRAVIGGAGEVGRQMARVLSARRNDVTVVDTDETLLRGLKDELDVMTVTGNAAATGSLLRAGIKGADLLLAVTKNCEANILACSIAARFEVRRRIARVNHEEYFG
ncbi:MAG: NAD-binding protein, partial [Candidatus Riflebacteria bacterium]|nr:NAD-binding protein [Candidatus Riflebacteria bacterium]